MQQAHLYPNDSEKARSFDETGLCFKSPLFSMTKEDDDKLSVFPLLSRILALHNGDIYPILYSVLQKQMLS